MARPPKTSGKLPLESQKVYGQLRQCSECEEIKEITEKHFTPTTRGLDGWKTICKVCENLDRSEAGPEKESSGVKIDPGAAIIKEMYDLHLSNQRPDRVREIAAGLATEIRDLHDAGEKLASFELFIDVVKPLVAGWMEPGLIHDDIKRGLMSDHRRRLIIATRYSAKSTLTSIYVAWRVFLDPLIKIMVVSRGSKLAARMLRTVRRVFFQNCPMLFHLIPTEDCLDNAEQFQTPAALSVVTGGATLTSLGMGSNLPGFRSDLTIGDDVEGPQDDTPEKVQQLEEDLNELHMINPRGEKIMLGTYQSEFSVYAKLADLRTTGEDGEEEPVWELHRACMFEEDKIDGKEVIHSRWPDMFSDADALDWRKSVTTRAWRLHAMLIADPSILHERPLKIQNIPVLDWPTKYETYPLSFTRSSERLNELPRWSAPKGDDWFAAIPSDRTSRLATVVMAVDPASGLAGRDAIGVAVLGITEGGFGIILHLEGVRAVDKRVAINRVAQIGAQWQATTVVVEELADGLFGETLEGAFVMEQYPLVVEKVTTGNQQKGRRIIENLAPPMGAGRIAILKDVVTTDHGGEFVNQLVRISYDGRTGSARQHDDIVDALAHAVQREKHSLISDISDNIANHRQAKLDRWATVPMRMGGLADADEVEGVKGHSVFLGGMEKSVGQMLLEEDEVLISLEERRDRYMAALHDEIALGRSRDREVLKGRIATLNEQIKELKELQVFSND